MIKARLLENEDYPTLVNWWEDNRFTPPGFDYLPQVNGILQGIMVVDGDKEICAGFIINTTVPKGAMIEYIVANFEIKDRKLRTESLNLLINTMSDVCKKMEKSFLFTSLKNQGLKKRFQDCGYVMGSTGTCEMIKTL
jgi:hypothetical protein